MYLHKMVLDWMTYSVVSGQNGIGLEDLQSCIWTKWHWIGGLTELYLDKMALDGRTYRVVSGQNGIGLEDLQSCICTKWHWIGDVTGVLEYSILTELYLDGVSPWLSNMAAHKPLKSVLVCTSLGL